MITYLYSTLYIPIRLFVDFLFILLSQKYVVFDCCTFGNTFLSE